MNLLDELEAKAKAATPGPWTSDFCGDVWTISPLVPKEFHEGVGADIFRMIGSTSTGPDGGNGAYIAAANPETILRLIAAYRELEAALNFYTPMTQSKDNAREALARAEKILEEK